MINYNYLNEFVLADTDTVSAWLSAVIVSEECVEGDINYIFCSDDYLHRLNVEYLHHDTLTDIISFDYSVGKELHGDIYISTDRVKDNAKIYGQTFENEMARVLVHGILHYCGYKDKIDQDAEVMRLKENYYLDRR